MVLSVMRRHAKSWLIKFLIGIIAVVFIFYFGYSFTSRHAVKIASVNGDVISGLEYEKTYRELLEALQRQYKNSWNDNMIRLFDVKNKALERLIDQKLISQEAKRLGFEVTEAEIQKTIMEYPAFQFNGRFDVNRYRGLLEHNRMSPEDFERAVSQELLQEKLRQFLSVFFPVTEKELLDYYTYQNEKIKISYVLFKPEAFKKDVTVDEGAMTAFFKERRETYRMPERISLTYVALDPDTFKDKVKPTEQEIRDAYEYNINRYKVEKQIHARHILFKLNQDADEKEEEAVKKKATAVLEEARRGADFAELAKKYSEGPTQSKGGDLGYFSAGRMVKPFDEAAFALKKGEISDLVRTPFGYHIIKVEDIKEARVKDFKEVREEIAQALIKSGCMDLAHEKGLSLMDQMPYGVDLAEYAKEHALAVKETGLFGVGEPIPGIGGSQALRESLFALEKREASELVEEGGKFYIFQETERKASYLPELTEVFEKVKTDFLSHLAAQAARSAADRFLAQLREGKEWDVLAKAQGLTPVQTGLFTRQGGIPTIGYEPDLQETAFRLGEGKRYPESVYENDKGAYVIRWEGTEGIDPEKYEKDKDRYRLMLLRTKQMHTFQEWLAELKAKADIEILQPVSKD